MFGKQIKLFSLLGFKVQVDLSWIIIAILIIWSLSKGLFPYQYRGLSLSAYWIMGIVSGLGLFLSIIIHEYAHSIIAKKHGLPMKGITLFIFGGVAEMSEEPPNAKAEFLMAIAGPISSVIIGFIFFVLSSMGRIEGWSKLINGIFAYLSYINFILAVFNLIPAFPLDGGRILRSFLWKWKGDLRNATRISSGIGNFFGIVLIIIGFWRILTGGFIVGMWWVLIGMFLYNAAKSSYQQLLIRKALEGETVKRFMKSDPITVSPSMSIENLVEDYIYRHHYKMFPVIDSGNLIGCVTTSAVKDVPKEEWSEKTVGEITINCSPANTIGPDEDAIRALSKMNQSGISRLMVEEDGRLVGIITLKDLLQFMALKVELDN